MAAGALALPSSLLYARISPAEPSGSLHASRSAPTRLSQDDNGGDDTEVPPAQVEKYIAVYKAMHRDRSLTVEKAAAQQGMSLAQFRDLENRIERDDAAREHVRDALQNAAKRNSHPPGVPASQASPGK
jgi:hypothetical protein